MLIIRYTEMSVQCKNRLQKLSVASTAYNSMQINNKLNGFETKRNHFITIPTNC